MRLCGVSSFLRASKSNYSVLDETLHRYEKSQTLVSGIFRTEHSGAFFIPRKMRTRVETSTEWLLLRRLLLGLEVCDHVKLLTSLEAGAGWDEFSDDDVFHEA